MGYDKEVMPLRRITFSKRIELGVHRYNTDKRKKEKREGGKEGRKEIK